MKLNKKKVAEEQKEAPKSPKISWFSKSGKTPKESGVTKIQEDVTDHKLSDAEEEFKYVTDISQEIHEEDLEFRTIDREVQTEPELLDPKESKKG